jgi:hypothetical protein
MVCPLDANAGQPQELVNVASGGTVVVPLLLCKFV